MSIYDILSDYVENNCTEIAEGEYIETEYLEKEYFPTYEEICCTND